jgi:steroid delta-isomerase-like uncharacterized protein
VGAEVSSRADKALVRRLFRALFNEGRLEAADEVFAPDYIDHVVRGPEPVVVRGPAAFKQVVTMFRTAFPDLTYTIEDQIEEDGKVVTRSTASGTHRGPFLGIAPTGRQVVYTGIDISRVDGGRIVEAWVSYDALGLLQQLGAVPEFPRT